MILHTISALFAVGEVTVAVVTWRTHGRPVSRLSASLLMAAAMLDMGMLGQTLMTPVGWAVVLVGTAMVLAAIGRFTRPDSGSAARADSDGLQSSLGLITMAILPLATGFVHNTPSDGVAHQHGGAATTLIVLLVAMFGALVATVVRSRPPEAPAPSGFVPSRIALAGHACMLTSIGTMTAATLVF